MIELYFDNASTTPVDMQVANVISNAFVNYNGNPSSVGNLEGQKANILLREARENIMQNIGATEGTIIFTGSGSEANNLALNDFYMDRGKPFSLLSSNIEHSSVYNRIEYYLDDNWDKLETDEYGVFDLNNVHAVDGITYTLEEYCRDLSENYPDTDSFISLMLVNNELGTIQPISEISRIIKSINPNYIIHTDATQAFGKIPINVDKLGVDMMTISGHKINSPKGIGALYVRDLSLITPLIHGGHQEFGKRAGTENLPYILGLDKAIEIKISEQHLYPYVIFEYMYYNLKKLESKYECVTLNGNESSIHTGIFSITVNEYDGEQLVQDFNVNHVYISNGSACNYGDTEPSRVLTSIGLSRVKALETIRVSLGGHEEQFKVDLFIEIFEKLLKERGLK